MSRLSALSLIAAFALTVTAQQPAAPRPPAPRPVQPVARPQPFDVYIRGGQLIDGSGAPARFADVGIRDDRIVYVGIPAPGVVYRATRNIDARGLIVSPGLIDPHAHVMEDLSDPARHGIEGYLRQGVTTIVTGNDGWGPFEIAATLRKWAESGIGPNVGLLAGYGPIREEILQRSSRAPTPKEMELMKALVRKAMDEGALGFSTGLFYTPQNFGSTEEVIELAKVAAQYGGIYDSHIRDESTYNVGLMAAIEEVLRIGRESGMAVHISHIKALGTDTWGKSAEIIDLIRKARAERVRVTADQYPYSASATTLNASLLPPWSQEGGDEALYARLDDPAQHAKIAEEAAVNMRRRGGEDSFLLIATKDDSLRGKRLGEIARAWNVPAVEAALRIIRNGGSDVASFNMSDADIDAFMKEDWVMTCSDGSPGHPRTYGTFPRKLRVYALDRKVITLEQAIHSSSALPADTFGLARRGHIQTGAFADVIVFDPKTLRDTATYEQPEKLAEGMRWVLVNGQFAIDSGKFTGTLAGRTLTR
jgi:N-acyl-D-aspartate/D-glutamate deacylase